MIARPLRSGTIQVKPARFLVKHAQEISGGYEQGVRKRFCAEEGYAHEKSALPAGMDGRAQVNWEIVLLICHCDACNCKHNRNHNSQQHTAPIGTGKVAPIQIIIIQRKDDGKNPACQRNIKQNAITYICPRGQWAMLSALLFHANLSLYNIYYLLTAKTVFSPKIRSFVNSILAFFQSFGTS